MDSYTVRYCEVLKEAAQPRYQHFLDLYEAGYSIPKIAEMEGLTRQRVQQLLTKAGYTPRCKRPKEIPPTKEELAQKRLDQRIFEFWAQMKRNPETDCQEWTGLRRPSGYGVFGFRGKSEYTHRLAWILTHGPIPEGLDVLHSCDNPPCCNPDHLHLGTQADNNAERDARGRSKVAFKKDFCIHGHPLSGDNLVFNGKHRYCRTCTLERSKKHYQAKKADILRALENANGGGE